MWNVKSCSPWHLYVIIDRLAIGQRDLESVAAGAIRGGADVIQLRDKRASTSQLIQEAEKLKALTQAFQIPLIVNDRVDVAKAVGADGVHLGQDDLPVTVARDILGPDRLIGKSTHSLEQALAAEAEGAHYIGLGPVFATPTKPDYETIGTKLIADVIARVRIPLVCIGGIERSTITPVLEAGAACVAVVRAVCAAEDPEAAARELKRLIRQSVRATSARSL